MKQTKKQKNIQDKIDTNIPINIETVVQTLKEFSTKNFDESVDIAVKLGIDAKKSDQNVRGSADLPHGNGKQVNIAVFANTDIAESALKAGAQHVGLEDLGKKFKSGEISVDVVIADESVMPIVAKFGQILGPKGLMPNPKTGTVTKDVLATIDKIQKGQVMFRNEKGGIIHGSIGKISFEMNALKENIEAMIKQLIKLKPAQAKGKFIQKIIISTTLGPGLILDLASIDI